MKGNYTYWTPEMEKFIIDTYKKIGDKELAELCSQKWPKAHQWTLKHIEKKRSYLKLKRTKGQIKRIRERNRQAGAWKIGNINMWKTRGKTPEGKIKKWGRYSYIKTAEGYNRLMRHTWEQVYGSVPKGFNVVRKCQLGAEDEIGNLELITDAELGVRNSANRHPYEIRQTVKILNQLNKKINEKQNK